MISENSQAEVRKFVRERKKTDRTHSFLETNAPRLMSIPQVVMTNVVGENLYKPPSKNINYGVYELMQMFLRSMTTGCQVTPVLYVPRNAWLQKDIKFHAFRIKMENFEILKNAFVELTILSPVEVGRFEKGLSIFRQTSEVVQNNLSLHISFINEVQNSINKDEGKGSTRIRASGRGMLHLKAFLQDIRAAGSNVKDKIEIDDYIQVLRDVFEQSSIFLKWIKQIDSPSGIPSYNKVIKSRIVNHLNKISEFFFHVVCNIVIKDMKVVVKRFIKQRTKVWVSGTGY